MEVLYVFRGDHGGTGVLVHCAQCQMKEERLASPQLGDNRVIYTFPITCPICGDPKATFKVITSNIDNKMEDIVCPKCEKEATLKA